MYFAFGYVPIDVEAKAETIQMQIAAGELAYRLTEPDEIRMLLGPPEEESEITDGGMLVLVFKYPYAEVVFGKQQDDTAPFTLRRLVVHGKDLDIGQNAKVQLRGKEDLAKLDMSNGLQDVSLTTIDLRDQLDLLTSVPFDTLTEWPPVSQLPVSFNPTRLLQESKGPGLGVREIHAEGIDGRGVGLAIIDQPLLLGHREYTSRLVRYDATGLVGMPPQMHSSPVASIAVGATIGVAPAAELSYYAVPMWVGDNRVFADALNRIVDLNSYLELKDRICTVSISTGGFRGQPNVDLWKKALERAESNGIFVSTCDPEFLRYGILSRIPFKDDDDPLSYIASRYANKNDVLLIPGGNRTLASHRGIDVYWFSPGGGMSWGAPYLSGLAALAYQVNPEISPQSIRALLVQTATSTDIGPIVHPKGFINRVRSTLTREVALEKASTAQ